MSLYDWLLFLHVAAAFALVAGLASFGVLVLVLGLGLAIDVDAYQPWDGWILGAIVLWLVAFGAGDPLTRDLRDPSAGLAPERARLLFAVAAVATLLLLVDMVFKPGA